MPFIYDQPGQNFPATQQFTAREWLVERPFKHLHPVTGEVTHIPASGQGTLAEMLENPIYLTDYRSGPDWIDGSVPKQGRYSAAWLKHDWGYATERKPRSVLDAELRDDLKELGATFYQRTKVWLFVRAVGWSIWRQHDRKKVEALRAYGETAKKI